MTDSRTTVMILVPGRNAITLVAPRAPRTALVSALVMPLITGAVAQHYVTSHGVSAQQAALASLSSTNVARGPTTTHVSAVRAEPELELEAIGRTRTRGLGQPPSAASKRTVALPRIQAVPRPPSEASAPMLFGVTRATFNGALPGVAVAPRTDAADNTPMIFGVTRAAFNGALPGVAVAQPASTADNTPMIFGVTRAAFNGALPGVALLALEPATRIEVAPPAQAALPEMSAAVSGSGDLPIVDTTTVTEGATIDVKTILRALKSRRNTVSDAEVQSIPKNGTLELQALHLGETVSVRPFDDQLQANPEAMSAIDHVMRCRITGTVIPIDPRLIEILVQLHTLYGKPIELVSGHRQPLTIGTKKTSQHALGRAADIRIPGVGIEELKRVAIKLGARGIGLYPEKGFVHVDVRQKPRYFWSYSAANGELGDGRAPIRPPLAAAAAPNDSAETHSEPESGEDAEATPADTAAADQHEDDSL
jgi:uncharacterized protein YcbK (DUF882 family)